MPAERHYTNLNNISTGNLFLISFTMEIYINNGAQQSTTIYIRILHELMKL